MSLRIDHAVIAVKNLDQAVQDYRDLGFNVIRNSRLADPARCARIYQRWAHYIELMQVDGKRVGREGLVRYALRTDDIEAEAGRLRATGIKTGEITLGEYIRPDGKLIQWKWVTIEDQFAPFLIQDVTPSKLRFPGDAGLMEHLNSLSYLSGIETTVTLPSIDHYAHLFGEEPRIIESPTQHEILFLDGSIIIPTRPKASSAPGMLIALRMTGRESLKYFDLYNLTRTHGVNFQLYLDEY
jgi:hypothetical protein